MKKLIFVLCTVCILVLSLPVSADSLHVIDNAGLLSEEALIELENAASEVSAEMGVDFVILTENGIGGEDPYYYAADFYDYGGYSPSGVILFLDMDERDWCIITSGDCISSVSDSEIDRIGEVMVPYLSEGQYASGFTVFLEETVYWMSVPDSANAGGYNEDEYYYNDHYYNDGPYIEYTTKIVSLPQCIAVGGFIGLAAALIVCLVMKSRMNTAKPQFAAGYYMVENSFNLLHSRDRFLYSNVTKVARPKDENHSGGGNRGGGGFRSSSGRSHGGGGGKF
ncbi:MAG: TPM domain-containing protein [Clostridia bacterium]|nr:TPM domain-containing protein [Clostridia bacterium]